MRRHGMQKSSSGVGVISGSCNDCHLNEVSDSFGCQSLPFVGVWGRLRGGCNDIEKQRGVAKPLECGRASIGYRVIGDGNSAK